LIISRKIRWAGRTCGGQWGVHAGFWCGNLKGERFVKTSS
jgi:hypothetical protein